MWPRRRWPLALSIVGQIGVVENASMLELVSLELVSFETTTTRDGQNDASRKSQVLITGPRGLPLYGPSPYTQRPPAATGRDEPCYLPAPRVGSVTTDRVLPHCIWSSDAASLNIKSVTLKGLKHRPSVDVQIENR